MNRFLIAGQFEKIEKLLDATGRVTNDDELREVFKNYSLSYAGIDKATLPDPLTDEYAHIVLELYSTVARREYEPSKTELTKFDTAKIYDTFPFMTRSPATTGAYFHFLGQTLGLFAGLKPGATILEFGPGWGETTLALARLGFDVTCVDINPDFIELIRRKAEIMGLDNLRGVVADFSIIGSLEQNFDAILFFECFHHCLDHVSLLEHCCKRLNPGGRLIFSGEPITADFPVPWGLRLDGQSLWSTASHGWLELGFSQSYFEDLLQQNRLLFTRATMTDYPFFCTYNACRTQHLSAATAPFASLVGRREGSRIVSTAQAGVLLYGPYLPLRSGSYRLCCFYTFRQQTTDGSELATLRLWHNIGRTIIQTVVIPDGERCTVEFHLDNDVTDLEFVIEVAQQTTFCFDRFELEYSSLI